MFFSPVHHTVILVPHIIKQIPKKSLYPSIVGFLFEFKITDILEIFTELVWEVFTEDANRDTDFSLFYHKFIVFFWLFFIFDDILPWKPSLEHIDHQIAQTLQIISPWKIYNSQISYFYGYAHEYYGIWCWRALGCYLLDIQCVCCFSLHISCSSRNLPWRSYLLATSDRLRNSKDRYHCIWIFWSAPTQSYP